MFLQMPRGPQELQTGGLPAGNSPLVAFIWSAQYFKAQNFHIKITISVLETG